MGVVMVEERESAGMADLSAVPLPELLALVRTAAGELTERLVRGDFLESLEPVAAEAGTSAMPIPERTSTSIVCTCVTNWT